MNNQQDTPQERVGWKQAEDDHRLWQVRLAGGVFKLSALRFGKSHNWTPVLELDEDYMENVSSDDYPAAEDAQRIVVAMTKRLLEQAVRDLALLEQQANAERDVGG